MARIGTFELPQDSTLADLRTEFVLGRVRRVVRITTVLSRFSGRAAFVAALENLEREIERLDRGETDFSIRAGRLFNGRRRRHEVARDDARCLAALTLEILTEDRFERSETVRTVADSISSSPKILNLATEGNWTALPRVELTFGQPVSEPTLSSGDFSLEILGDFAPGEVLVADSEERVVTRNGTNILAQTSGDFIELAPGGATLAYSATAALHDAAIEVTWRDRWV